ncbi:MAG TPA: DoxX family protein [Candidatus Eremiobacteraceae bacterium]|nr:DoxX family protein [Candidatus Eremiobacteraceae bacterium]
MATAKQYGVWLAVFRILVGATWLIHGYGKLSDPQWALANGDCYQFITGMTAHTEGALHDFVTGTVLPNITVFATLVEWGETLVGASLVLGLLTRIGGLFGMLLPLLYFSMKGAYAHLDSYAGLDILTALASGLNLVLPTGAIIGLDALIGRRGRGAR